MVEAEEKLEKTLRASSAQNRVQRQRMRWIAATAASYGIDALFLVLFAAVGTIPLQVPAFYAAAAAAVCVFAWLSFAKGWNLRYRDPNLTEPLILVAILMQLAVPLAAPQVALPFLANLFTVFAFGMIWLTVRDSVAVWSLGVFGTGVVFYAAGDRFGVPTGSRVELFLVWLYFSLILGRCLLVSVTANETRARLTDSRRQLADTLDQVQRLASHDELTRALNRRALITRLEQERSRAERSGAPFSVGMMDLDRFKAVNDNFGHAVGDQVLKTFAETVSETMRMTDVFGRYGGEEFLLIHVGTAPALAREAMERIRVAVERGNWDALGAGLRVTVSTGIAGFRKGESIEQLLHRVIRLGRRERIGHGAVHVGGERVLLVDARDFDAQHTVFGLGQYMAHGELTSVRLRPFRLASYIA